MKTLIFLDLNFCLGYKLDVNICSTKRGAIKWLRKLQLTVLEESAVTH